MKNLLLKPLLSLRDLVRIMSWVFAMRPKNKAVTRYCMRQIDRIKAEWPADSLVGRFCEDDFPALRKYLYR